MRRFFLACAVVLGWAALVAARPANGQGLRVPLGADTGSYLRFSGQERVRGESWSNWGAGVPASAELDDAFGLSRLMLRGELQAAGKVRLVAELKSSLASTRSLPGGVRTSDEDELDAQQLYGQVMVGTGGLRTSLQAGRFDLAVGRERLVGPLDWTNARRAFQGALLRVAGPAADVQLFWTRPVTMRRYTPDIADSSRQLYGVVAGRTRGSFRAEAYWLRSEVGAISVNGTSGSERLHTLGVRAVRAMAPGSLDYDVEGAWQAGTLGGQPVRAWMVGSVVGRSLRGTLSPRIYAGLDAASGDRTAGGPVQTFNQLYPTGHAFLGYADVHGRQNVVAVSFGASVRPARGTTVQLDAFDFRRASTADGLYAVDGSLSRAAGSGYSAHVGDELDLTVKQALFGGRLGLQAGASRYFAGDFLRQSGGGVASDVTFLYGQATVVF